MSCKRSYVGHYLACHKPGIECLLDKELHRIEAKSQKDSRSSQHKVLLKLASSSHARHVRDSRIERLTRLMASDEVKAKKKSANSRQSKKSQSKEVKQNIRKQFSSESQKGIAGHHSETPKGENRRESNDSRISDLSATTISYRTDAVRFSQDEILLPKHRLHRTRAFSVDIFANPAVVAKRRQSAPEVIITPAKLQQLPENFQAEYTAEGNHLSPSFSVSTEFFESSSDLGSVVDRLGNQEKVDQTNEMQSDVRSSKASHLKADFSGAVGLANARSRLSMASRKHSRSTVSRRRHANLPPQVQVQTEELVPMKDSR